MYVSPLGDKAVGGLSNYCLYKVNNVSTNEFQLQNVESAARSGGFQYRLYGGTTPILNLVKSGTSYIASGIPYNFTSTTSLLDYSGKQASGNKFVISLPITTSSPSFGGFTFNTTSRSIELFGYYYARSNATYTFQLQTENAVGYMWLGTNAIEDFNSKSTTYKGGYLANNAGYITGAPLNSPSVNLFLSSNSYLPIRIHYSTTKTSAVSLNLLIKDPLVSSYTLTNFSVAVGHRLRVYGPLVNSSETTQSSSGGYWYTFKNVQLGNGGTSYYGKHALMKAYPINYIVNASTLNIMYNVKDEIGTAALLLKKDVRITIFSRDYLRGSGPGLNAPDLTFNNYGGTTTLYSYPKANITYKVANSIITNSTSTNYNITLSGTPTINALNGVNNSLFVGLVSWLLPTNELTLKDSFYYKKHGIGKNDTIIFNAVQGGGLPGGLLLNTNYTAEVLSTDYFRLKTSSVGSVVDITSYPNSELSFIRQVSNVNAYTIYAPAHDLLEGTYVQYKTNNTTALGNLINDNFYYIRLPTATRFRLSLTKGGDVIKINTSPTTPDAQSVISIDKATDGNYIINNVDGDYGFTLLAQRGVPRRYYDFLPNKILDLQRHTFKYPSHNLTTGARIIYKQPVGQEALTGLTDSQSYFIIREDVDYFKLSSVAIDESIETSDGYISLYNQINNNYIIQFPAYPVNPYNCNHTFIIPSIGGQIKTDKVLTLTHSCNIIRCDTIDFLSTTKLGDLINIYYNEQVNTKTINTNGIRVGLGTDADFNNSIFFTANHNLVSGDSLKYNAGTNYIRGLSNDFTYYVNSNSLNVVSLYYSSNAALSASIDGTFYTGGVNGRIKLGITGITTTTAGNFTRYTPGVIQSYQIRDINNKNYITLENNISLPSYVGVGTTSSGNSLLISSGLYPRSDSYVEHRAYNGGVEIVPSLNPDSVIIRQTRRYFRYQSGKGIQLSKAINFSAPVEIISMQRGDVPADIQAIDSSLIDGTFVTVTTRKPHRLRAGVEIKIRGVDAGDNNPDNDIWNSIYNVYKVDDNYTNIFYIILATIPDSIEAGGFPNYIVTRSKWGSYLRAGLMDDQNGIFFEFDGETLYACRRNSVKQVTGTVTCTFNSQLVIGTDTRFTTQLGAQAGSKPQIGNDRVVIRGTTYKVILVLNDETIYIQPPYRGVSGSDLILSITEDTKVAQEDWSIDKCDGTGPTGFNLDIHAIQMMYIDYSWYGAGKVRFGFKVVLGEVRYVHEFIHNNKFIQAYMRSGNVPARYEVGTYEDPSFSPALLHWGTSVIMDGGFDDDRGYIFTANGKQILYFNKDTNSFILADAFTLRYLGASDDIIMLYDSSVNQEIPVYRITIGGTSPDTIFNQIKFYVPGTEIWDSSGLSLFGSLNRFVAYPEIIDKTNRYLYVANLPLSTALKSTGTFILGSKQRDPIPRSIPLVSIRLAPAVDTGKGASLGQREIINRMQLTLTSFGILTTHDCEVKVVLNGIPFYKNYERINTPSLSQAIYHSKFDSILGGLPIYTVRVTGGSIDNSIGTTEPRRLLNNSVVSLADITSIGNSIIAGNGIFPDGPDLLTIVATPLDINYVAANRPLSITARVSWKEAQA